MTFIPDKTLRSVNLTNEPGYDHTYILRLPNEDGTGTHNSKYLNESGISRKPIREIPAEQIMAIPHPEKMTKSEYINEKTKRLAHVLRNQGKTELAKRAEAGFIAGDREKWEHFWEKHVPASIEKEVAKGETVVIPKSLLIKQLEAPPAPLSLYPSHSVQLLDKGKTIELPGTKLDKMLQRTEKKQIKQPRKTEKQKHETVKTRQCTPPVHVHAYDVPGYTRKCPTNKGKKSKGK